MTPSAWLGTFPALTGFFRVDRVRTSECARKMCVEASHTPGCFKNGAVLQERDSVFERQLDDHRRAAFRRALDVNSPMMSVDHTLGSRKAQTGASCFRREEGSEDLL